MLPRTDLITRIIADAHPVVHLQAPAGYGKSELLHQLSVEASNAADCDSRVRRLEIVDDADLLEHRQGEMLVAAALAGDLRLVLASSVRPAWLPADLELRGQQLCIGITNLAATRADLRQLATLDPGSMRVGIDRIWTLTEGWWLGINACRSISSDGAFQDAAARYCGEALYEKLETADRRTLLLASLLDRFDAELFHAVTGSARLFDLARSDQLILPADPDGREWRLHPLYARFLQTRVGTLGSDEIDAAHRRAADWYAREGRRSAAAAHALNAGDPEFAAQLIDRGARALIANGQISDALEWLQLPGEDVLDRHPRIAIFRAAALILAGREDEVDRAHAALDHAVREAQARARRPGWLTEVAFHLRGQKVLRDYLNGRESRADILDRLLEESEAALPTAHGEALSVQAMQAMRAGRPFAPQLAQRAQPLLERSQSWYGYMANAISLATNDYLRGNLREAEATARRACQTVEGHAGRPIPAMALGSTLLAEIAFDREDDDACEDHAMRASYGVETLLNAAMRAQLDLLAARRASALGQFDEARACLDRVHRSVSLTAHPLIGASVTAFEAVLLAQSGDRERAAVLLDASGAPLRLPRPREGLEGAAQMTLLIARARVEALSGRAKRVPLGELVSTCRTAGFARGLIEALLLRAYERASEGQTAAAKRLLAEAYEIVATTGHLRLWHEDYGPALSEMRAEFGTCMTTMMPAVPASAGAPLSDPLTRKERQILKLVASGRTNPEIAGQLHSSLPTVKWHVRNILTKLDARGRVEAIAQARAHGLLH